MILLAKTSEAAPDLEFRHPTHTEVIREVNIDALVNLCKQYNCLGFVVVHNIKYKQGCLNDLITDEVIVDDNIGCSFSDYDKGFPVLHNGDDVVDNKPLFFIKAQHLVKGLAQYITRHIPKVLCHV